jgi:hypothetical protein
MIFAWRNHICGGIFYGMKFFQGTEMTIFLNLLRVTIGTTILVIITLTRPLVLITMTHLLTHCI